MMRRSGSRSKPTAGAEPRATSPSWPLRSLPGNAYIRGPGHDEVVTLFDHARDWGLLLNGWPLSLEGAGDSSPRYGGRHKDHQLPNFVFEAEAITSGLRSGPLG